MANPFDTSVDNTQALGAAMPQPSGLSYEADIVPLKQRFFQRAYSDPRLASVAGRASMDVSKSLDSSYKDARGLLDMEDVSKQRKVQFESSVFELERAREKANRERTMMDDLKPVSDILSGILGDPNLDPAQRKTALGQVGVQFAGQAAMNPAIATAFDAANRSITAEQSDRLTAMDYLRGGADPAVLKAYEQSSGQPLAANANIPIGIFATGMQAATDRKVKAGQNAEFEQRQYDRTKSMMDSVDKAGLFKNEMKEEDPSKFEDAQTEMNIIGTISAFGTPEQREAAAKANARDKIKIAKSISTGWNMNPVSGAAAARPTRPSAGSFATR